jgi:hypothetical protein
MTSKAKAAGRFDKSDFIYIAKDDQHQCPAGERAILRFSAMTDRSVVAGRALLLHGTPGASAGPMSRDERVAFAAAALRALDRLTAQSDPHGYSARTTASPDELALRRSAAAGDIIGG